MPDESTLPTFPTSAPLRICARATVGVISQAGQLRRTPSPLQLFLVSPINDRLAESNPVLFDGAVNPEGDASRDPARKSEDRRLGRGYRAETLSATNMPCLDAPFVPTIAGTLPQIVYPTK
jgi:hypothetical protein